MRISELGQFGRGSVVLRGKRVEVVPVSQARTHAVYSLFPIPIAPMGPEPGKGSLAPWVPQTSDPTYVAAVNDWNRKTNRIEVALALHLEVDGLGFVEDNLTSLKAWCEAAQAEIAEGLTAQEVAAVLEEIKRIGNSVAEDARKN